MKTDAERIEDYLCLRDDIRPVGIEFWLTSEVEPEMKSRLDKAIQIAKGKIPSLTVHIDMQKAGQAVLNLMQAKAQYLACENPTTELDEELAFVLGRVRPNLGATEMQQTTQAAMHLMQAKALHEAICQDADKPARVNKKTN